MVVNNGCYICYLDIDSCQPYTSQCSVPNDVTERDFMSDDDISTAHLLLKRLFETCTVGKLLKPSFIGREYNFRI